LLTKPVVKVFFSEERNEPIAPARVDLSDAAVKDSIVGREPRARWEFTGLESLWAGPFATGAEAVTVTRAAVRR